MRCNRFPALLKIAALTAIISVCSACQVSYLLKSTGGQIKLLTSGVPIEKALEDKEHSAEDQAKIKIASEARLFAESELSLAKSKNYTRFVKLDRPYVTYVVSASPKWELRNHQWSFPIVGKVPYKGFFNPEDAKDEESLLKSQDLDTYLRGVSAYSTLGWFSDPLLSSMLRVSESDLVNTVIHETVHATIYIKSSSDFNERIATFIGNKGTEVFYFSREGADSTTVKRIRLENDDEALFSSFITHELSELKNWYKDLKVDERSEEARLARIKQIQKNFEKDLQPRLKTDIYKKFPGLELNNARLNLYRTYVGDMSDFQNVFDKLDGDFGKFIRLSRLLEKEKEPEATLKKWAQLPKEEVARLLERGS